VTAFAVARRPSRVEAAEIAVRRLALGMLLLLGLSSVGLAAWSLAAGGIGRDTRIDTYAALTTRGIGGHTTLQQAYAEVDRSHEFYGVFIEQAADAVHSLTTGSTAMLGPDDPKTYLYQGAVVLALAVAAVTALAVVLALALRSWLAGAFAWSLTLATPLWLGMEHVDFKDVPVAAGLTLATSGLTFAFLLSRPWRATLVGAACAGIGGAVAVATRPASIVLLAVLVTATLSTAVVVRRHDLRSVMPVVLAAVAAPASGLALTWATDPIARLGMVQWLNDSIAFAHNIGEGSSTIRAAGEDLDPTHLPWWYVPSYLGVQLPSLTLAAVVGGAGVVAARVRRLPIIPLVPVVTQAIGLPVLIVTSGAELYDGIRHVLFLLPALLALPALALALLDRGRLRAAVPLAAAVIVAASLVSAIQWAPYAYAYLNPIGGLGNGRAWDLDYWGVTAKEGVERLRRLGLSPIYVKPSQQPGVPWGAYNTAADPTRGAGLYVFLRWQSASDFGCKVIFTIDRGGHVLGEGALCLR
jgi:hypothetical protein